jgi:hypothetical protein
MRWFDDKSSKVYFAAQDNYKKVLTYFEIPYE